VINSVPCCKNPPSLTDTISPFNRTIALDFYDGPTGGILQCSTCQSIYKFDMLDWDDDHQTRIFRFALLPADSLAKCVLALAQPNLPRLPVWVPPSKEAAESTDRDVQRILDQAQPAELVVAWIGYGEKILAAKRVPPSDLMDVPDWSHREDPAGDGDWFSRLGLVKEKANSLKCSRS
jgi:hypothetical protein